MRFFWIIMLLVSCSKVDYHPNRNLSPLQAEIAHRGRSGQGYRENTLEGCIMALKKHDGVEVDIQISRDGTIWLSHSVEVFSCGLPVGCFPELTDAEIAAIDSCAGRPGHYSRLEDLVAYMAEHEPDKYLSVDLKGWVPCHGHSLDIDGMMRLEAETVARLGEKYGMAHRMMIETETLTPLFQARKVSEKIGLYLNNYGNPERGMLMALKYGLNGISFKHGMGGEMSREYMDLYHRKGLRVIVWNLSTQEEFDRMRSAGADFIQFDFP